MMIEQFIDNVLIIDDKPDEVQELINVLNKYDIYSSSYTPEEIKGQTIKNKQIIFCDLFLSKTDTTVPGNISELRNILKIICSKDFGSYGIVLWTNHKAHISDVKSKISTDKKNNSYITPLFIIGLDKQKYIQDGYDKLFNDLNTEIEKDKAAHFFVNWSITIKSATNKALSDIYSLVPDYDKQQTELLYILYRMAINHTGIPENKINEYDLSIDAYKAFDELLYSDLINQQDKNETNLFKPIPQNPYKSCVDKKNEVFSKLNSKMFIDTVNIQQEHIIPGNVYEILEADIVKPQVPNNVTVEKYIAIELTPPCDFSNEKKINSRLIKGFLCNIGHKDKFKKDFYYKDMYPLTICSKDNLQLIFDFRHLETVDDSELKDETKYKVLFRVSPKLFADILQKFSSSYARLGLSKIE